LSIIRKIASLALNKSLMLTFLHNRNFQYISLFLFCFLLYGNTLTHEFALDDKRLILENKDVQNGEFLRLISHGTFYGYNGDNAGAYRPASMIFYSIIYQIGNGNPRLYHFFNVLLYFLTTILILEFLKSLIPNKEHFLYVFAAVLLFASHPIHTEVVANAKSADEILCLFFGITACFYRVKYIRTSDKKYFYISLAAFIFSMLSKETGVAWIVVVFGLPYVLTKKIIINKGLPLFADSLALVSFILLRYYLLDDSVVHSYMPINNSLYAISNSAALWATKIHLLGFYILKVFWAVPLSWDYSFGAISEKSFTDITVWVSLTLILISGFLIIRHLKSNPLISFALVWFWALLIPVSNTFILIETTFAERFLYSPSIGLILLIPAAIPLLKGNVKNLSIASLALLTIVFSKQTIARNAEWKNDQTIVQADVKTSGAIRIKMSYISDLFSKAEAMPDPLMRKSILDSALVRAKQNVELLPEYSEVNYLLARTYLYLNKNPEAEYFYQKTLEYESTHSKSLNDLGVIYGQRGDYPESIKYFIRAYDADNADFKAAENVGIIAIEQKDVVTAKNYLQKALAINPYSQKALISMQKADSLLKHMNTSESNLLNY
jgi:protein O-mannosyl-transferase